MSSRATEIAEVDAFMGTIDARTIESWCKALARSGRQDAVQLGRELKNKLQSEDPDGSDGDVFDTRLYEDEIVALKIGVHMLLGRIGDRSQADMCKLEQLVRPLPSPYG